MNEPAFPVSTANPAQDEAPLRSGNFVMLATESYRLADAMLVARVGGGAA